MYFKPLIKKAKQLSIACNLILLSLTYLSLVDVKFRVGHKIAISIWELYK